MQRGLTRAGQLAIATLLLASAVARADDPPANPEPVKPPVVVTPTPTEPPAQQPDATELLPTVEEPPVAAPRPVVASPALAPSETAHPQDLVRVEVKKEYSPAPAQVAVGPYDTYRPVGTFDFKGFRIQIPLMLNGRAEGVSAIAVDRYGGEYHSGTVLSPQLRLGALFETLRPLAGKFVILAEYEHDLPTGEWSTVTPIDGTYMPNSDRITTQIRKGYARFSLGRYLHIGGGLMTSHWGMGLLANDGAHGWEPGSARFTDPRGGNLVARGFLATGPLSRAHIVGLLAVDQVRHDDILTTGDSALQFIASALAGAGGPHQGGFFLVYRRQKSADGHTLDVTAVDLAGKSVLKWKRATLTLEGEVAGIFGTTTLAPNTDFSRHEVIQVGAAARANLAFGVAGGVLDLVYASGDQNFYDNRVTNFKADHNYETGLLLFRYVEAAQSGRGAVTAADPTLVGAPSANLERVPTRGGITNAVLVFPRFWVRPVNGLEAYGGPLVAIAPVKNVDPLNTNLAGGAPRNALNNDPGNYWGTELDLGLRYRMLIHGTELTLGLEGGILFSGSALRAATGTSLDRILGGRAMLTYRL